MRIDPESWPVAAVYSCAVVSVILVLFDMLVFLFFIAAILRGMFSG